MSESSRDHVVNRRTLLGVGAAGLAGLAGCTDTSNVPSAPKPAPSAGKFHIPDSDAVPDSKVELTWMDSGDQKAEFWKPFFDAYHEVHDNVTVSYKGTNWDAITQSLPLALRNGSEPDVFQLPGTITTAAAVNKGWLGAFDDVIPDWEAKKKRFPLGYFANGVTDFDGKTYALTSNSPGMNPLLLFNKDLVSKADADPGEIMSLDDFRAMLRKITKQGDGDYYGIIDFLGQTNGMTTAVDVIAEMGGLHNGVKGINWLTGEYNYTDPITAEVVEWYLAMHKDGSFLPGSVSMDAATARGRFPQGQAAVIFQGPWNIRPWVDQGFPLGLNIVPQRDPDKIWPIAMPPAEGNKYFFSARSKYPKVIGDMFGYLLSDDGQQQWAMLDGAADPAAWLDVVKDVPLGPLAKKSIAYVQQYKIIGPAPSVRNQDVAEVYKVLKQIQPNFHDVCVGLFTGQLTSVSKQLKGLQDRSEKALEEAIAKAKKRGANVSRDDWKFSDWDPSKPYEKLYQ